jgi:hypothetical protein
MCGDFPISYKETSHSEKDFLMADELAIEIEPKSGKFDPSDGRWLSQVNELITDCQKNAGKVTKKHLPEEGKKGGIEPLLLALGTSGAITAAVDIFKAWLARDKTRSIKIKIDKEGVKQEIEVTATGMDADTVRHYLNKALSSKG